MASNLKDSKQAKLCALKRAEVYREFGIGLTQEEDCVFALYIFPKLSHDGNVGYEELEKFLVGRLQIVHVSRIAEYPSRTITIGAEEQREFIYSCFEELEEKGILEKREANYAGYRLTEQGNAFVRAFLPKPPAVH